MRNYGAKNFVAIFIVLAVCVTTALATTNTKAIETAVSAKGVTVNYQIVDFPQSQKPLESGGTLYVPLVYFAEALGYETENYLDNYINIGGGDVIRYKAQSDLLKEATDYLGVDSPEKAAFVWAEGVRKRSGAMQYSVMTKNLKEAYEKDLAGQFVTGMSSPWIEHFEINETGKSGDNAQAFEVNFSTITSAGPSEPFAVKLEIIKDGDFWRISKVLGDEISLAYTGFKK